LLLLLRANGTGALPNQRRPLARYAQSRQTLRLFHDNRSVHKREHCR
jgi:hypothetical protein